MMKKMLFVGMVASLVFIVAQKTDAVSVLFPQQGGTGISTTTAGNAGKALIVSSTNPIVYTFGNAGGGTTTTFNGIATSTLTIAGGGSCTVATSTDGTGQAIVTITCTGNGSSTNVFGVAPVSVAQAGTNATVTFNANTALNWGATQTFQSSTVFQLATATLLSADTTGKLQTTTYGGTGLSFTGNTLSWANAAGFLTNASVTATSPVTWSGASVIACPSCLTAAVTSLNGSTGTYNLYVGGMLTIATGTASTTITFINPGFVTAASSVTWTAAQTFNATATFNSSTIISGNLAIGTTTISSTLNVVGTTTLNANNIYLTQLAGASGCLSVGASGNITTSTCSGGGGGSGTVGTTTAVTTGYYPFWGSASGLTGTSSIQALGGGGNTSTAVLFNLSIATSTTSTSSLFVNGTSIFQNGNMSIGTSSNNSQVLTVVGNGAASFVGTDVGSTPLTVVNANSAFTNSVIFAFSNTGASSNYRLLEMRAGGGGGPVEFKVDGLGNVTANGSLSLTGSGGLTNTAGNTSLSGASTTNLTVNGYLSQSGGLVSLASTTVNGSLTVSASPQLSSSTSLLAIGTSSISNGNASGTWFGILEATSSNADLINFENYVTSTANGVSIFKVASSGAMFTNGTFNASGTISQSGTAVVLQTRNVNTTAPLSGGGALSGDLTITCPTCSTVSTSTANTWSALQTFTGGATFNSTGTFNSSTVLSTVTSSVLGTNSSGLVIATSVVNSFGGNTGAIGVGAYLSGGATLNVSSTLASSSVTFIFANPTTTLPLSFEQIYTNTKKTITYIDCWEYAVATDTVKLYYNTTLASSGIQQLISSSSIACGVNGTSTTTFTTSTLPSGAYLFAIVSSTAGSPTELHINVGATKQ